MIVAVDIPIGLLDHAVRGGRNCDRDARGLLGQLRARSVFSPPVRGALQHSDYPSANSANRASSPEKIGISKQSFGLRDKLVQADEFMTPELQETVKEVHPEVSFYELNGGRPMKYGKKDALGLSERRESLLSVGFDGTISIDCSYRRTEVAPDDIVDACAACWTATRILEGEAISMPASPQFDSRGLCMQIWR